jgi:hypothetical protein
VRERVSVEARLEADGRLRPRAFEWKGRRFQVASLGRQWQEGSVQHFLVMTSEEAVFELAYASEAAAGEWWLLRAPKDSRSGAVA